jgi:hypothetical protein
MSHKKRNRQAGQVASKSWDRLRRGAAQVKPAARRTGAAAKRGVHKTRAWAAPQIERTGQVLQDRVAPKASSLLTSAAERLEPRQSRRTRWLKLAAISSLTAAASAVAALARKRSNPGAGDATPGEADASGVSPIAKEQMR